MIDEATPDDRVPSPARSRVKRRLTGQEQRDRRRRLVTWALSVTFALVLIDSIVGESGYIVGLHVKRQEADLRAALAKMRLENQSLQEQGHRLQDDPQAVEERARGDLGMLRPGEIEVIVRDVKPTPAPAPAPTPDR
ncbi:MAG: septum formation initiator family protein [Vicinamibacterales bacterium]